MKIAVRKFYWALKYSRTPNKNFASAKFILKVTVLHIDNRIAEDERTKLIQRNDNEKTTKAKS